MRNTLHLAFGDGTPRKALLTALVIGTMLTIINHGDLLVIGEFPHPIKVLLTYLMPYCVTTWGAIIGKKTKLTVTHGN